MHPSGAPPRRHVLVVDDNHDAADLAAAVLRNEGHDVTVAYSGVQALERVAARAPDIAILDIGLPDIDGVAVAEALSASAGFDLHLTKPVDPHHGSRSWSRGRNAAVPAPHTPRA